MNEAPARGPIQDAMGECLARHRGRPALAGSAATLTYEELGARIADAARTLRGALPAGGGEAGGTAGAPRHVGFWMGNGPAYVILYFATLHAGDLPLLLDANFNTGEIESIRGDCGLDALICEPKKAAALALPGLGGAVPWADDAVILPLHRQGGPPARPRPATQVCRFTSGTTGRPKCLEFSGEAVVSAARNWVLGTGMKATDRTLCLAALSNGLAFNTSLLSTFVAGGELHFLEGVPLTRPVARRIAASGITRLVAFPALYRNFVAPGGPEPQAMASLSHAISAGAPLWPDVREEFRARYGLDISDYYGIAETGPCTFERSAEHHIGLGEPLPGVELRIAHGADDRTAPAEAADGPTASTPTIPPLPLTAAGTQESGEVLVRTSSMASGYLNFPGLFESRVDAAGFYHSGDRGRIVDGRLHLTGRTADHINVAGRKIDPTEVAGVVAALPGVTDAVAFPDEDLNRETMVHLVVVAPSGEVTRAAVAAACRSQLAPYKVPGRISFVGEIPRTGIGKPRLALLREQLRAGAAAEERSSTVTGRDEA